MNATYLAVIHTYTSRRWLMVALAVGALFLTALLVFVGDENTPDGIHGMQAMNFLALPIMLGGLLVAMQAKYQFVHPRARLTPGYAKPHLAVLAVLLVSLTVLYPAVTSWRMHYSPLGVIAFATLFGSLVVWQIQVMSGLFSLASLALFFSFFQPSIAQFWIANSPSYALPRLAILAIGVVGLVAWLWRLTQMNEQDSDYLVPVQSGFNQLSRMEKSEARQLVSRWISRNPVQRFVVDGWHDRLAAMGTPAEAERPKLLRYGMWMVPIQFMAVQCLVMIVVIASMQFFVLSGIKTGNESFEPGAMMLGQFGILSMVIPFMACHILATRRGRLGQDLLLPLTREALVDGLRSQFVAMVLWTLLPAAAIAAVLAPLIAPKLITLDNVVAVVATAVAVQFFSVGISLRLALVQSGLKRMAGMLLMLYLLMGLAVGMYFTFTQAGYGWGALFTTVMLAIGVWSLRWARRAWLSAELG